MQDEILQDEILGEVKHRRISFILQVFHHPIISSCNYFTLQEFHPAIISPPYDRPDLARRPFGGPEGARPVAPRGPPREVRSGCGQLFHRAIILPCNNFMRWDFLFLKIVMYLIFVYPILKLYVMLIDLKSPKVSKKPEQMYSEGPPRDQQW